MEKTKTKKAQASKDIKLDTEEMMKAGLHFGHRVSRLNPKMKPFVVGVRNTVHIIDLDQTAQKLAEALKFIGELAGEEKTLLFIGTKIQLKELVKKIAKDLNLPYVTERWLGGTFTNFQTILKRIEHFKKLGEKKASDGFNEYSKKEKIKINKELERLKIKFEGIKNLAKLPDAIFITDLKKDGLAAKEAKRKGIKIIAIADTNVDPSLADFPIPASDDAISSVKYILDKVKETISGVKPKK